MFHVFQEVAHSVQSLNSITVTDARRLYKACKNGSARGSVDVPIVLHNTWDDPFANSANLRVLELLTRAQKLALPVWFSKAGVVVNMRTVCALLSTGHLDLAWLIPSGAKFTVCKEDGAPIAFDMAKRVSLAKVEPGSRVFVRHDHRVDMDRAISVPGSLHGTLHLAVLLLSCLDDHVQRGGILLGQDTQKMRLKEVRELVVKARSVLSGRSLLRDYCNLSALSAVMRAWETVLGEFTPLPLRHLPRLMYILLRLRVSKDHSLRQDPIRYRLYFAAGAFVPCLLVMELAELARRKKAGEKVVEDYLDVRSFKKTGSVALALDWEEHVLCVDADDSPGPADDAAAARKKQKKARDYAPLQSVRLSGLLAIPAALSCIAKGSSQSILWSDIEEGKMEAGLKFVKRAGRDTNGRDHTMDYMHFADNAQFETQQEALLEPSERWDCEGVRELCIGECYLQQQQLAVINLVAAIKVACDGGCDDLVQCVVLSDASTAVTLRMGLEGSERIVFCCCGRAAHRDALLAGGVRCTSQGRAVAGWIDDFYCSQAVVPPPPPDCVAKVKDEVINQAKERQRKADQAESVRMERDAVVMLLQEYGFLEKNDPHVTADVLKAFKECQPKSHFYGSNGWPSKMAEQITYLYERQNTKWSKKS